MAFYNDTYNMKNITKYKNYMEKINKKDIKESMNSWQVMVINVV